MQVPTNNGTDERFPEYEAARKEIAELKAALKKQTEDYQRLHVEVGALRNLSNRYLIIIERMAGSKE